MSDNTGEMLSREQLLHLFSRFSLLVSQPDVKKRIVDAVRDNQEAVAVTTAIQEEILLEMGIDPRFGIGCLGKVNTFFENDMELMIKFYQFVAKDKTAINEKQTKESSKIIEEMAIDEAELEPNEFAQKINAQQVSQDQQLEVLQRMRQYSCDEQTAMLDYLRKELEGVNFDLNASSILTPLQLQEIVKIRN